MSFSNPQSFYGYKNVTSYDLAQRLLCESVQSFFDNTFKKLNDSDYSLDTYKARIVIRDDPLRIIYSISPVGLPTGHDFMMARKADRALHHDLDYRRSTIDLLVGI